MKKNVAISKASFRKNKTDSKLLQYKNVYTLC